MRPSIYITDEEDQAMQAVDIKRDISDLSASVIVSLVSDLPKAVLPLFPENYQLNYICIQGKARHPNIPLIRERLEN